MRYWEVDKKRFFSKQQANLYSKIHKAGEPYEINIGSYDDEMLEDFPVIIEWDNRVYFVSGYSLRESMDSESYLKNFFFCTFEVNSMKELIIKIKQEKNLKINIAAYANYRGGEKEDAGYVNILESNVVDNFRDEEDWIEYWEIEPVYSISFLEQLIGFKNLSENDYK